MLWRQTLDNSSRTQDYTLAVDNNDSTMVTPQTQDLTDTWEIKRDLSTKTNLEDNQHHQLAVQACIVF